MKTYTLKVKFKYAKRIWRSIEVRADQTLDDLHAAIQAALDWDGDHLYSFFMSNQAWDEESEYASPEGETMWDESAPKADDAKIGSLGLQLKQKFMYIFDFGDEHRFEVEVIGINPNAPKDEYPRIVDGRGNVPPQYPDYDEEEEVEESEENDEEYEEEVIHGMDALMGLIVSPDALMSHIEDQWRAEAEATPITIHSKHSAALNKLPAEWINGVCIALGLSPAGKKGDKTKQIVAHLSDGENLKKTVTALSPRCRDALQFVLEEGGWVKYGQLSRRFGDEAGDGWWWVQKGPPASVIGQLRARGLLFVGKAPIQSRNYRVAVIPKELRTLLPTVF